MKVKQVNCTFKPECNGLCLLFFLMMTTHCSWAQCPTGPVQLTTQQQVIDFGVNFPSCTAVGNLTISGSDITDLTPLQNLLLAGSVSVEGVSVVNLNGLHNIRTVTGGFGILNLEKLTSLGSLKLKAVQSLSISGTPNLPDLTGLDSLTTINSSLTISRTPFVNLTGLENLQSIDGRLTITSNAGLVTLSGLNAGHDDPSSQFELYGNPLLTGCAVPQICVRASDGSSGSGGGVRNNGTGCSSISQVQITCAAMPVTLKDFSAEPEGAFVSLRWETADEVKFKGFQIQRSLNATEFSPITWVDARGQYRETTTYGYTDQDFPPVAGTIYYRLKMVDFDESFRYSKISAVKVDANAYGFVILGNPANGAIQVLVSYPKYQLLEIKLQNARGQILHQESRLAPKGTQTIKVPVPPGMSGVYLLSIGDGKVFKTKKVIVN